MARRTVRDLEIEIAELRTMNAIMATEIRILEEDNARLRNPLVLMRVRRNGELVDGHVIHALSGASFPIDSDEVYEMYCEPL